MQLIKKISAKTVCGDVRKVVKSKEAGWKKEELFRVFGIANKIKTGDGDNGPWSAAEGQFKAVCSETGEEFAAGVCFLPDVAQNMVNAIVTNAEGQSVEFGFIIYVTEAPDSMTGYTYAAEPLIKPTEDDPLERLEKQLGEMNKLAAPKKDKAETAQPLKAVDGKKK